jgi:hypothetical protein
MNALLSQAADLRAQAHTLAEQALFGDLFASTSTETIDQLNAQADELEAQAAAPAPAPALAVNDDVEVEPSPAEQLNAIFADLLSPVSEPVGEVPAHDDDELLSQWRDANRAGEGRAFGDPDVSPVRLMSMRPLSLKGRAWSALLTLLIATSSHGLMTTTLSVTVTAGGPVASLSDHLSTLP